ncbi:MAG TPA: S8 family peptidase [Puia sp.]|nr:S8 family peptidase [Puia sp.]
MSWKKRIFCLQVLLLISFLTDAQISKTQSNVYSAHGWQLQDYRLDSVFGAGVNKAYDELLKGKKASTVIVAVIDAGLDTAHEDLVGHIWTNTGEIPGNGIDDDHNGYVDDVHGWNFLGGKDGRNITIESYESYREYYRLKNEPGSNNNQDSAYREKVRKYLLKDSVQLAQAVFYLGQLIPQMRAADSIFKLNLHKDSVYARDVAKFQTQDSALILLKKNTLMYFKKYGVMSEMPLGGFIKEADSYLQISREKLKYFSGDPNALRRDIVGDDFNNINDRNYGNNNVAAGTPTHGTHVAGIIAASRGNGKGMDGIDAQVYIMALRAVPDGDERDKDIALAIRYAVDNGARIINMSFEKYLSPGKKWVDDAVRYAEEHDILLVDAAGNEFQNLDSVIHFPNPEYELSGRNSCCWLTVGANAGGPDSLVMAPFSNYGKKEVDLFAPGVKVYSTLPGNQYASYSGTSMAAPMVSGIAALLLEYYPDLSARQLKYILTHSVMKLPENEVKWPGPGQWVDFNQLSASGGIINAYNALKLAATMKGERENGKKVKIKGMKKD